jgi:putative membrane protein insertion efficiency factor/ribonuclease P protein component
MLAAEQRLRRKSDFTAAVRTGRRAGRGGIVVHVLPASTAEPGDTGARAASARAGFVVPKAVGNAVTRNRVRRSLRHLVRTQLATLPPGTDVVVRVLPAAAARTPDELGADLAAAIAATTRSAARPAGRSRYRREERARESDGTTARDGAVCDHEAVATRGDEENPDGSAGVRRTTGGASRLLMAPIVAYRRWISPGLPDHCRFYPTCSEYAMTAIATHGPVRGMGLAVWRLLRCHPFHPGGIDPVPPPRPRRGRPTAGTPTVTTRLEQ